MAIKEDEIIGCLGDGAEDTDYVLCEGDIDILPTLYKKDEIRYEYNQYKNSWSYVSCTIFSAVGMISDLFNYKFTYDEIKEIDELSYERGRKRGHGWYVQSAVKLVADRWNEKMDRKVAYYRISKWNNEIIEDCINKLYTIDGNCCPNKQRAEDRADGMIDGTDFGKDTNGHSLCVVCKDGQRSIKDSGSIPYYGLKNKLSSISNIGANFYVYVPVSDNLEEIKRLNEIKSECNVIIEHLQKLYHLVNDTNFQGILHYTAEKLRKKIQDCNEILKKLS